MDEADHLFDVVEFMWATIELLDDAGDRDTAALYRPFTLDLHTVLEAREHIFRREMEPAF